VQSQCRRESQWDEDWEDESQFLGETESQRQRDGSNLVWEARVESDEEQRGGNIISQRVSLRRFEEQEWKSGSTDKERQREGRVYRGGRRDRL
jgi:hypothetical protein